MQLSGRLWIVLFCALCAATAQAATVTLQWDPPQTPGVAGYVVSWGTQPGAYSNQMDVGNRLSGSVSGLANATTYYFAVQTYNTSAQTSGYSMEVAARLDSSGAIAPLPGDFNKDGRADLIWRQTQAGDVSVWKMNGGSSAQSATVAQGVPLAWRIEDTGDLDGDMTSDIVWRNVQTGDVAAWLFDGTTTTVKQGPVVAAGVPQTWEIAKVGDLDGDGKSDIVWRNWQTGDVAVWFMNGTSVRQMPVISTGVPLAYQIVGVADFDRDGKADLLWRHMQTGDVSIWLMNGGVVKQARSVSAGVPLVWRIAGVGDLDGDGEADLLWRQDQSGDVAVWLMNGTSVKSSVVTPGMPLAWQIGKVRDIDGDGKADIVWRQTQTGDVAVWLMNGGNVRVNSVVAPAVPLGWQIQ